MKCSKNNYSNAMAPISVDSNNNMEYMRQQGCYIMKKRIEALRDYTKSFLCLIEEERSYSTDDLPDADYHNKIRRITRSFFAQKAAIKLDFRHGDLRNKVILLPSPFTYIDKR